MTERKKEGKKERSRKRKKLIYICFEIKSVWISMNQKENGKIEKKREWMRLCLN